MKILLTGKNGQLGFELQRALAPLGEMVAVDQAECDLADGQAIRRLLNDIRPEVVVNPAAYTAVDQAESEPEKAFAINAEAPRMIGEAAATLGALVLHFSTDYVFDGTKQGAYGETDPANPQNVYGQSKHAGEVALKQSNPRHLILRTSWVVGAHGSNFAKTILRLAAERESLNVVADQWGAPTSAALLADVTAHLLRQWQQGNREAFPYGIYHVVNSGETSWHEYARFVVATASRMGQQLKLQPVAIRAISSAEYPVTAKRPANSRLDTTRFRQTFGLSLPSWQSAIEHLLQQVLSS